MDQTYAIMVSVSPGVVQEINILHVMLMAKWVQIRHVIQITPMKTVPIKLLRVLAPTVSRMPVQIKPVHSTAAIYLNLNVLMVVLHVLNISLSRGILPMLTATAHQMSPSIARDMVPPVEHLPSVMAIK